MPQIPHEADFIEVLAQHSAGGEDHILDAAHHFVLVRVLSEAAAQGGITEENFDRLTDEAYLVFVESTIRAYHTWLSEIMATPPLDQILHRNRHEWDDTAARFKEHCETRHLFR